MRIATLMTILAAPVALAACNNSNSTAETDAMPMDGAEMAETAMQTASAEGTVAAIDADAGTITIEHGPVPAIGWPAMTMPFEADEQLRNEVSVGDAISFEFETGPEGNVVTSITRA